MIEKFNLTLTGTIKTNLYENQASSLYPTRTVDEIELPGKVSVRVKKGYCSFSFWAYPSIHVSYPLPETKKEIYKGRFEVATSFEAIEITNRIDNAIAIQPVQICRDLEGVWRGLNVKGHLEYKGLKQEFIEFDTELVPNSSDLYVRANWPQRYYFRAPLEMRTQYTTLILDEKSLKKFNEFWDKYTIIL